jgi:dihydroorotase
VPGCDADIALCDLGLRRVLTPELLRTKVGWSPWTGQELQGWPRITILRGQVIFRDDEAVGVPSGRPVRCAAAVPILAT